MLEPLKEKLAEFKDLAIRTAQAGGQPVTFVVLSYTHNQTFSDLVLNLLPREREHLDLCLTTKSRCDYGGKLWLLRQVCHSGARVWHADDNVQIVREFLDNPSAPGVVRQGLRQSKCQGHP